ncbi:hypothetical protein CEXT_387961, partial [Caerostris extrusa]
MHLELVLQTEFGLAKQAAQNSFSSRLGNKYHLSGRLNHGASLLIRRKSHSLNVTLARIVFQDERNREFL